MYSVPVETDTNAAPSDKEWITFRPMRKHQQVGGAMLMFDDDVKQGLV